jgi:hypothetical protein
MWNGTTSGRSNGAASNGSHSLGGTVADIDLQTILLDGEVLGRDGDDLVSVPLPTVVTTAWAVVDSEALAATAASVTLTAPPEPVALRLTATGLRSTDTTDTDRVLWLTFNGDGGANYSWMRTGYATNGTDGVSASNAADDTGPLVIQLTPIPSSQTNTNRTGIAVIHIDHHAEAAWKAVQAQGYAKKSAAESQLAYTSYGTWKSTARIASVTLTPSVGSWAVGGTFVLEGLYL